jgi:hypothetical protein
MDFTNQSYLERNIPTVMSQHEIDQVSGGLAPLIVWGLWTGGGVLVGLGAAYVATHWK